VQKTAELIEMQFELLSQVSTDYKEHYMGVQMPPREGALLECLAG